MNNAEAQKRVAEMTPEDRAALRERFRRYCEGDRGAVTFQDAEILVALAEDGDS